VLEKILKYLFGKLPVTERSVQRAERTLSETLVQKGFSHPDQIPASVRTVIVQEAFRRASERSRDGCVQVDHFCEEIEAAADEIIAAFNGDEHADSRIRSILVFHKVLE